MTAAVERKTAMAVVRNIIVDPKAGAPTCRIASPKFSMVMVCGRGRVPVVPVAMGGSMPTGV